MTTPDTAAVRTWARENGMSVAERGRLPAEVREAYLAAQQGTAAPAKSQRASRVTKKATAKGRSTTTGASPATGHSEQSAAASGETARDAQTKAGGPSTAKAAPEPASANPPSMMSPAEPAQPDLVAQPDRVAALVDELAALTARVAHLEQSSTAVKPSRFRRRSS